MEIMFDDLTYEAQARLLEAAGAISPEEMNWDEIPVAVVEFEDEEHDSETDFLVEGFFGETYDLDSDEQA
ncbi:MAG: hypothetical protein ABIF19_05245 [Planctomycetota bacterium]